MVPLQLHLWIVAHLADAAQYTLIVVQAWQAATQSDDFTRKRSGSAPPFHMERSDVKLCPKRQGNRVICMQTCRIEPIAASNKLCLAGASSCGADSRSARDAFLYGIGNNGLKGFPACNAACAAPMGYARTTKAPEGTLHARLSYYKVWWSQGGSNSRPLECHSKNGPKRGLTFQNITEIFSRCFSAYCRRCYGELITPGNTTKRRNSLPVCYPEIGQEVLASLFGHQKGVFGHGKSVHTQGGRGGEIRP